MVSAALRGFVLGFAIAATPGPMFFLCLRRTLVSGWRAGLASGLGIATADAIYAAAAAAGIGAAGTLVAGAQRWITLAGGLALLALGARALTRRPSTAGGPAPGLPGSYATTLLLTLANPAALVSFAAVFAGIGLAGLPRQATPLVVAGTAMGSLSWWLILVGVLARIRMGPGGRAVRTVGLVSGAALAAFGVVAVAVALR